MTAAFRTGGTVSSVRVAVGDEVEAGDVLATMETADLKRAVTVAQANLVAAQAALDAAGSTSTSSSTSTAASSASTPSTSTGVRLRLDAGPVRVDRRRRRRRRGSTPLASTMPSTTTTRWCRPR